MNVCELCQKNPCECADRFGGDTGIDADYLYQHNQINEISIEEDILKIMTKIRGEDNDSR
jgi:hypothetical protein|tara:strand:- start:382 stop:561 length:180 start_codon:yes stop_codon:yes gene_type:complete